MSRKVDDKKTKRTLRRLARARREAETRAETTKEDHDALSEWEDDFLDSLEERLETFGSAFADPDKGSLDEPLSSRQALKLREIEKKAKGKARKPMKRGNGFKRKSPGFKSRSRDINDDVIQPVESGEAPVADDMPEPQAEPAPNKGKPPAFRIIDGGKPD